MNKDSTTLRSLAIQHIHSIQEQHKLSAVADWEHKTDNRIKALNVNKRFEALKDRRQAGLERRQLELTQKLAFEECALQHELLSSQTTPEQRRAELTARARSLAARRESERQKLAADLYEQQFRENCDLLRGKESQIATHNIQHVQQQQVCGNLCNFDTQLHYVMLTY